MKVSDLIVKILEKNEIDHIFGIPGVGCGHFMNSLLDSKIQSHLTYNEQGAAFAACGYAQASNKVGFAYSTAGPGGTNLITGIANAYADSIPTIFMVGEKDLSELKNSLQIRQKASQEVDIVDVCKPITKWSVQVKNSSEVKFIFEKAFYLAKNGRPGPILIDMPSDIARQEISDKDMVSYQIPEEDNHKTDVDLIINLLNESKKPLLLFGNALKQLGIEENTKEISSLLNIPVISSLMCSDCFIEFNNYIGNIGMDGDSSANYIVNNCDLLITFGSRLNFKQIGYQRDKFASKAKIIRIDIDDGELSYRLNDEHCICANIKDIILLLNDRLNEINIHEKEWLDSCLEQKRNSKRNESLNLVGEKFMDMVSQKFPTDSSIVVDTGSHRRWYISKMNLKKGQRFYQSSGLASMGYALPASIGVCYANPKNVICIDGDGGIMMNLQELQLINRERLPITIFVFNNHALGDIMEFQKKVFLKRYYITTEDSGYKAANFEGIAKAFDLNYQNISSLEEIKKINLNNGPQLIEIIIPSNK